MKMVLNLNDEDGKPTLDKHSPEMNYLRTFVLTDDKIRMNENFLVEPGTSKVSGSYEGILAGATMDISKLKANKEIEDAFNELEKLITPEMLNKMDRAESKYNSALEQLVEKYTESRFEGKIGAYKWRQLGKMYQKKVDKALKQYRLASKEYEKITAILDSNGVDPAAFLISKAKTKFENWKIQLGSFESVPYTFMSPSDWYSPYASGWTKYDSKDYKTELKTSSSSKSFKASGSAWWNLWSVDAGGGYSSSQSNTDFDMSSASVTFQYLIAKVSRPWMDTSFTNAKNWYIKAMGEQPYPSGCISSGEFNQEFNNDTSNESVFLPSVITSIILIKDFKLTSEELSKSSETIEKSWNAGLAVGWGPFKIGGSYGTTKKEANESFELHGNELSCDGIQLIGYVSEILPKSPWMESIISDSTDEE